VWRPSASIEILKKRAALIAIIREFFAKRHVIEVETPLLSQYTVTDPHIPSISAESQFLQTSPEYAMKRLLAAGMGSIYQICKAFRQSEKGQYHNPEFTMLEWYRPGFDHHDLMDEMCDLLKLILPITTVERLSYQELFEKFLAINPHKSAIAELKECAKKHNITMAGELTDRDAWLNLLISHVIEPQIGKEQPIFIYDFPASQAALSKIRLLDTPVASRFELYFKGVELANGFHELLDAKEQRERFEANNRYRQLHNLPMVEIDKNFLAALEHGLPDCAGVALGIDRLMMLALGCGTVKDVISFDITRA
jgi:elongation factor P--(R)-beta-lysine ligase